MATRKTVGAVVAGLGLVLSSVLASGGERQASLMCCYKIGLCTQMTLRLPFTMTSRCPS